MPAGFRSESAIWGAFAGVHLALLAAMTGRSSVLEDLSRGSQGETSEVGAVVSWFGPTDFLKMDDYLRETGPACPTTATPTVRSPSSWATGSKRCPASSGPPIPKHG